MDPRSLPSMSRTLSEADSKAALLRYGVPFAPEHLVADAEAAVAAATAVGLPVAAKLCGDRVAHKTERGLVRLGLGDAESVRAAATELLDAARPEDDATGVLIAPMISGNRELIAGLTHDEQFGATVLVGIGGVLAEAVADVAVRLVPITEVDAHEMLEQLASQTLLGEFRGEPAIDRDAVVQLLLGLSDAAGATLEGTGERIVSVDLNPLIISDGRPVAVDALVEVGTDAEVAA
jgi:succinyl-CoA synthetase beta subunit